MLEVGIKVKDFTLKNSEGKDVKLSDLKNDLTVIFFYPKNNTIGCTKEACSFNDLKEEFDKRNVSLIGISTDSYNSHRGFINEYSLDLELLSDSNKEITSYFGVINEQTKSKRAKRVTFILDSNLKIVYVFDKVRPATHGREVLDKIIKGEFN